MSSPRPELTIDRLRKLVRTQGGEWTTARATDALYSALNRWITPERARQLLNQLVGEGLLIKHGVRGRLWTQPPATDLNSFTQQVAQQVREIPGVVSAEVGEDAGLIGARHVSGGGFLIEVRAGGWAEPVLDEYDRQQIRRDIRDDEPEGDQR